MGVESSPFNFEGAVAQLGEHLVCNQGVGGSIPLSSTIFWAMSEVTVTKVSEPMKA